MAARQAPLHEADQDYLICYRNIIVARQPVLYDERQSHGG